MNKRNKTLIILSPGFPANEADTECLPFPQLFVRTLKRLNPSLDIIVLAFQYPFSASEYWWYGVRVIAFNGRNKGKMSRLILWRSVWKRLKEIIRENEIAGILNLWLGESALIGSRIAKKKNIPSFTWLLGQDARRKNRYFFLIKPDAGSLIALSDSVADEFYKNYGLMPANIIPPGIDMGSFSPPNLTRDIDIMGAGSLIPLKQYGIFIKLVAALAKTYPGMKTLICGEGAERLILQRMIDGEGLSANIELCGKVGHNEILRLMQRSKIFLHPSSYEGFATVLSEALYAGAHVISFCDPMRERFKNHHVAETEVEMLNMVNQLLSSVELRHEKVITYPIEETCRRVLALYGS